MSDRSRRYRQRKKVAKYGPEAANLDMRHGNHARGARNGRWNGPERAVFDNVLRKEAEAEEMARELVKHVAAYERAEIEGASLGNFNDGHDTEMEVPAWLESA